MGKKVPIIPAQHSKGMSSYNYKSQVPSDVPTDGHFIESTHLKSQEYLEKNQFVDRKSKEAYFINKKNNEFKFHRKPPIYNQDGAS